jgi:hypothetical protein
VIEGAAGYLLAVQKSRYGLVQLNGMRWMSPQNMPPDTGEKNESFCELWEIV